LRWVLVRFKGSKVQGFRVLLIAQGWEAWKLGSKKALEPLNIGAFQISDELRAFFCVWGFVAQSAKPPTLER